MENLKLLLEPQNLVFVLPAIFAIILLLISMMGGVDSHGADHDTDHDVGHDTDHENSLVNKSLSVLGVGRAPLMIVLTIWGLSFGVFGLLCNLYVWKRLFDITLLSWPLVVVSFVVSFILASICTRKLATLISKIMPQYENYGISLEKLVYKEAEVLYLVTASSGAVTLRDREGNLQQVNVKTDPSYGGEPIPSGAKVLLWSFNEEDKIFTVVPVDHAKKVIN